MNRAGLLDYQGPAAEQLLAATDKYGAALDGSDLGTGKTATACAVIRARDLPTLVVCPAVCITGWRRMGEHLGTKFSIVNYEMLRTGRTPFGQWEHPFKPAEKYFQCESCQIKINPGEPNQPRCPHHYLGIHCLKQIKKPHKYGKFLWNPNVKQLVFDEVHRCSALDSLQSDMLVGAKRQRINILGLSATSGETPLDFRALGYALGLHNYADFYQWAARHGCRKTTWGGFQFLVGEEKKKAIMGKLHDEIFPEHGARVRIADLGDSFPEVQITAELYDLEESGRIDKLYAEMDEAIRILNDRRAVGMAEERPMIRLLRAHQELELLKIPIFEEVARDAISSGLHVALFVNYRQTVEELCKRLKTKCRIDGSQIGEAGAKARQGCIDAFQRDEEPAIVCSSPAGNLGINLHDTHGNFPRLGVVSLGHSAVITKQLFGRLRRAMGKSKALYRIALAANTVEVKIHRALAGKLNCIDALNDRDLMAANLPLTSHSIEEIFKNEC